MTLTVSAVVTNGVLFGFSASSNITFPLVKDNGKSWLLNVVTISKNTLYIRKVDSFVEDSKYSSLPKTRTEIRFSRAVYGAKLTACCKRQVPLGIANFHG